MTSIAASRTPPELTDIIIDHLHDNIDALAVCSVVCKAWLSATRYHLFHSVFLAAQNANAFLDLLDSPWATIAPYVRHLSLTEAGSYAQKKWLNEGLPRLEVLERVESLRLNQMHWGDLDAEAKNVLLSRFKGLRALDLFNVVLGSFSQLADFMDVFPSLERVFLQGVSCNEHVVPAASQTRELTCLRHLRLTRCPLQCTLTWLLSAKRPLHIDTVHLQNIAPLEIPTVNTFLRTLGPGLRCVRLGFNFPQRGSGDSIVQNSLSNDIDLVQNNALQSLHFDILYLTNRRFPWVAPILARITSPHMQEITLNVWLSAVKDLDGLCLGDIEQVLAQPLFAGLQNVHVFVGGSVDRYLAAKYLRASMPLCDGRGILQIC